MRTASASSWKHKRFTEGKSIPYKAVWNDDQFTRVTKGLKALEMEDRWLVFYEAPHVFFHRSWTGQPVYKLTVIRSSNGYEVTEALSSINFTTDPAEDSLYQAKLLDFLVSNLLLGESKPFPLPPGVEKQACPGAIQHTISGTGYREQLNAPEKQQLNCPKKPRWRIW
jgi:hypothetical protein